jgi:predicted NBD/HSP70 family sugar kinase/biotin operon repressor
MNASLTETPPSSRVETMGALEDLRELNRKRVIDALRLRGTASRAEIARAASLSRTTVAAVLADLQASGLVVEHHAPRGAGRGRGRPAALLSLDASAGAALGIDFGHGHLHIAIADLASTVLAELRVELDPHGGQHAALDRAAALVHSMLADVGVPIDRVLGAGAGLPGPVDPQTVTGLADRLHVAVTVDTRANLGALAEAQIGAARGRAGVVYVKVASRIGAGIVLDGRVHRGATGIAGEIGHVQVRPDGDLCRCGNRGCLETIASTTALLDALRPAYGSALTVTNMLELARDGDVGLQRVIMDAGRAIGRMLADLCNSLNPDAVVVGGELSGGEWLLAGIRESIDRYAQPGTARAVEVIAGTLGRRASVEGALMLVVGDTNTRFLMRVRS